MAVHCPCHVDGVHHMDWIYHVSSRSKAPGYPLREVSSRYHHSDNTCRIFAVADQHHVCFWISIPGYLLLMNHIVLSQRPFDLLRLCHWPVRVQRTCRYILSMPESVSVRGRRYLISIEAVFIGPVFHSFRCSCLPFKQRRTVVFLSIWHSLIETTQMDNNAYTALNGYTIPDHISRGELY